MARRERYVVGLDVGTSKVAAIVGEMLDDGSLDVVGIGVAESHGIRRGVVVNLEAAVESIKKAIEEAELTAGVEIDLVHLGDDQFLERLQSYVDLSAALHERVTDIEYVDVRFDNQIYVRPVAAARMTAAR